MLDIKECRKIKRDYTKNNESKTIIINVENYPLCYMIITHENGKSWGYFFEGKDELFLGMSNQLVDYANLEIKEYSVFSDKYSMKLIGGNDAVKSTYSKFLDYLNTNYYYYRNYNFTDNLRRVFRLNPILFANLTDSCVFKGHFYYGDSLFYYFDRIDTYINDFDYTKPLIKQAFNIPAKWVKLLFRLQETIENINLYRKYNYTIEDFDPFLSNNYWYSSAPKELFPNKPATLCYINRSLYRDYYNMYTQLSEQSKSQFPLFPKDLDKYHDKIVIIYNREQAFRKKKELEDKQKAYVKNVYKKASKYDFSDENYFIKACEELTDLLFEGNTLHHCVGSYINSVSAGKEYILFLRKNSDPDTPYFTIDVTPDKHVRQIHGLCNCNMTEDIKPFVETWAKKFKLDITNCSGVRCALYWYII